MTTRFYPSSENLRITVADDRAEEWGLVAVELLLKRVPGKVYFLGREGIAYPRLREAHHAQARFAVVEPDHEPSNFLECSRVVHGEGAIWVVSASTTRFSTADWREFAERLDAIVGDKT